MRCFSAGVGSDVDSVLLAHREQPIGQNDGQVGSGYLLLAMGEAGTLAAALGFLLLAVNAPSVEFTALRSAANSLGPNARWGVFLLTFFGFGVKAGLVPVNSWLQRAYAAAPRAFAPVLAGATLNLGLYGILRVNATCCPPPSPSVASSLSLLEPPRHSSASFTRPRTTI